MSQNTDNPYKKYFLKQFTKRTQSDSKFHCINMSKLSKTRNTFLLPMFQHSR